jgi:hypothetical protein
MENGPWVPRSQHAQNHFYESVIFFGGTGFCRRVILRDQSLAIVPDASEVDLRFGDPPGELKAFGVRFLPDQTSREGVNLVGIDRIERHRDVETMAQGVFRGNQLSGDGLQTGAGAGVDPIGLALARGRYSAA